MLGLKVSGNKPELKTRIFEHLTLLLQSNNDSIASIPVPPPPPQLEYDCNGAILLHDTQYSRPQRYLTNEIHYKIDINILRYGSTADNCTTTFMGGHTRKVLHQEHSSKEVMKQSDFQDMVSQTHMLCI